MVETIERRGGSGSGGGGGAPSVGSRVSKRSGMGSSRGKGSKRYARFSLPVCLSFSPEVPEATLAAFIVVRYRLRHHVNRSIQRCPRMGHFACHHAAHSEPQFSPQQTLLVSPPSHLSIAFDFAIIKDCFGELMNCSCAEVPTGFSKTLSCNTVEGVRAGAARAARGAAEASVARRRPGAEDGNQKSRSICFR